MFLTIFIYTDPASDLFEWLTDGFKPVNLLLSEHRRDKTWNRHTCVEKGHGSWMIIYQNIRDIDRLFLPPFLFRTFCMYDMEMLAFFSRIEPTGEMPFDEMSKTACSVLFSLPCHLLAIPPPNTLPVVSVCVEKRCVCVWKRIDVHGLLVIQCRR